jgi:iron complex outermembrane receptor protein
MRLRVFLIFGACITAVPASAQTGSSPRPADDQALFGDLPTVEAVSLHAQTLAEAPANVTVITAEQIHKYGYRTLAEALASVRGFYITSDHTYHYAGVSGISLPGDFNTRFLVMLNGHPLTDNIYGSNGFFGQDFGLDMDLVERIEIIRGPTSALYGSNGMLANINVVTRSPVDGEALRVSSEVDSTGQHKLAAASSLYLGGGANLLISGSVFDDTGIALPLAGLALPSNAPASGVVSNADGEHGYHSIANLIWRHWSFTAYFNSRDKQPLVGLGTSLSGDPAQHVIDSRDLVGAVYTRQVGPGEFRWQAFYDRYRYHDLYDYPIDNPLRPIEAVSDVNLGDQLNTQATYAVPLGQVGTLTAGVEGFLDLRSLQYNLVDNARQDIAGRTNRGGALFAQQEWKVSARWALHGGLRLDQTRNFGHFLSPRLAAVYRQSAQTVYKLVYGHPFRNPSAFEQYYNDGGLSYAAAPPLRPESAHTFQGSMERRVGRDWTLTAAGFQYLIQHVIEAVSNQDGVQQYQNTGDIRSTGGELELAGKLWDRVETTASMVWQAAVGQQPAAWLPNSPRQIVKLRAGTPAGRRLFAAGDLEYLAARATSTGSRLGGFLLVDSSATLRFNRRFDLVAGVHNLLDKRYQDAVYVAVDRVAGDGRSVFLKLVLRVWE